MTSHSANGVVKTSSGRPSLPYQSINPHLAILDHSKLPAVKFQVITRDGQEIVVGRIKIQTPSGHAFILRRYDTDAISQTTMFRAAFPTASDDLERSEAAWIKHNFDSTGANGGSGSGGKVDALRLAGVWVRPEVAKAIAPEYSLDHIIEPLLDAKPDPTQEYRRSTKPALPTSNSLAPSSSPLKPSGLLSSPPGTPRPKRRKPTSSTAATHGSRRGERTTSSPPPVVPSGPITPGTRTNRTRVSTTTTTTTRVAVKPGLATPEEEDEGTGEAAEEEVADVPGPNMHDDIAEQRDLIAKLKAERALKAEENSNEGQPGPSAVPLEHTDSQSSAKRAREDEEKQPLQFQFREPGSSEERRKIRSNRRISLVPELEPQQKSAAWGALWFAAGLAAAATIPSFFM